MNATVQKLPVILLPGLHLDTLGHYFAALGLLRLAARKWPKIKGCWRDGIFCLIGGPQGRVEFEGFLQKIGANKEWTPYTQDWSNTQKRDTKDKTARNIALWRANNTDEEEAVFVLSHIATAQRLSFNPIFGTGGNAGKRNFSKGWQKAVEAIEAKAPKEKNNKNIEPTLFNFPDSLPPTPEIADPAKLDLSAFIDGEACSLLADYGAACWFSAANKIYNFSPDKPYRDGQITPWAMLFACESFPLLVGGTSRQIGSKRQGTGAFPFVTQGVAPKNTKESGTVEGEFWAPVWEHPLSVPEVSALFKRGRAEANGRGAITSAAFATAVIQKGTDAGLSEFRRFTLLHTTSAQTFESRLASILPLSSIVDTTQADAIAKVIRFRDALPREYKKGKSWIYFGLQGPIDHALISLAAAGADREKRVEGSWKLLDAVFSSLEKTANNKTYREREPSLTLLPAAWALSLLKYAHEITPEIRVALTLATLRAESPAPERKKNLLAPLIAYRTGVEPAWGNNWRRIKVAKNAPLRVVWGPRGLTENLCEVIRRRVAVESEPGAEPPFNMQLTLALPDALAFLNKDLDDTLIDRWLRRFLLFDWNYLKPEIHNNFQALLRVDTANPPLLPEELLYVFLRPLFHVYTFRQLKQGHATNHPLTPTANMLRPLVALLERSDTAAAYRHAIARYKSLLLPTADFGENTFDITESNRLLAGLFLPASPKQIAKAFSRWVMPADNRQRS